MKMDVLDEIHATELERFAEARRLAAIELAAAKAEEKARKAAKTAGLKQQPMPGLPLNYSLEGLNCEGQLPPAKVVSAIRKFRSRKCVEIDAPRMSFLLSGVPGTGKTAFARYVAHQVGMRMITAQASDILSCYHGETERRIARAFAEARKLDAILFLDEIDGLLPDRRFASQSFEITQTNQLLQSMESFEGVLIGATNLVENLDEAVMRRFTYKLKLSYLTDLGKSIFFQRYFKTPLTEAQKQRLDALDRLTPGDFRTVKEGLYYLEDKQNNDARIDALEAECAAKGLVRARIGF